MARTAIDEVGPADDSFFLFSEETDWAWRFRAAGWRLVFTPDAGATHVSAASHKGRLFVENLRGQLRFLRKHRGDAYAERARKLLLTALRLRAALFRGARGGMYREGAAWLASGSVASLLG
jgi:GT2 family glycosyltransferase